MAKKYLSELIALGGETAFYKRYGIKTPYHLEEAFRKIAKGEISPELLKKLDLLEAHLMGFNISVAYHLAKTSLKGYKGIFISLGNEHDNGVGAVVHDLENFDTETDLSPEQLSGETIEDMAHYAFPLFTVALPQTFQPARDEFRHILLQGFEAGKQYHEKSTK